jgi:hypothetical protein
VDERVRTSRISECECRDCPVRLPTRDREHRRNKKKVELDDLPVLRHRHPVEITTTLLRCLGREKGDAAIIVGKSI